MADITTSPLFILATALAYVINADNETTFEEKAKLITAFGKHVSRGEMTNEELHAVMDDAFEYASRTELDLFLRNVTPNLTPGQKVAIFINIYDTMLVDGIVMAGEKAIINKFIGAFDISRDTVRSIREVLMMKNDTAVFTDRTHPYNEPSYRFELKIYDAGVSDSHHAPQLTDKLPGMKERWKETDEPS